MPNPNTTSSADPAASSAPHNSSPNPTTQTPDGPSHTFADRPSVFYECALVAGGTQAVTHDSGGVASDLGDGTPRPVAAASRALLVLPGIIDTQTTDLARPKAHVTTKVADHRQLSRPRPAGHRFEVDAEHLRDLGRSEEFVPLPHRHPRGSLTSTTITLSSVLLQRVPCRVAQT